MSPRPSVNVLNATMSERELSEARQAAVSRNESRLRDSGAKVPDRLAKTPESDPAGFKELMATYYPDLEMKRGPNGELFVLLEGTNFTNWKNAVRMGEV